jgi:glucose-1-phosphatase
MALRPIRNIIFDFGGILFAIDYHLPIAAFRELGFGEFDKIYTQAAQSEMFDRLETGKVSNEEFMNYLHAQVPQASMAQVAEAWNCILLHLMPEKVELVQRYKNSGFRTFLLSNTNAIHAAEFEKMIETSMGLSRFREAFEKTYYSHDIGIKKPYPETYLQICAWNHLDPSETLFVDDSIQHVKGAAEAGLHALHVPDSADLERALKEAISKAETIV